MRNTDIRSANDCATPSGPKMAVSMQVCNERHLPNCVEDRCSAVATNLRCACCTTLATAQAQVDARRACLVAKYALSTPQIQIGRFERSIDSHTAPALWTAITRE